MNRLNFLQILLALIFAAPSSFAADNGQPQKSSANKTPSERVKNKVKGQKVLSREDDPYSIAKPFDPNNPPPEGKKVHPVSSNAH